MVTLNEVTSNQETGDIENDVMGNKGNLKKLAVLYLN